MSNGIEKEGGNGVECGKDEQKDGTKSRERCHLGKSGEKRGGKRDSTKKENNHRDGATTLKSFLSSFSRH